MNDRERLTITDESGYHHLKKVKQLGNDYASKKVLIQKLGDYENAEEKGELLRVPCKVGDKIYIHQFDNNLKKIVVECEIIEHNKTEGLFKVKTVDGRILTLLFQFIGKTVFVTREEAEKALKGE